MALELKNALRRRVAPSHQMTLDLIDDDGSKFSKTFRLSFDMNVIVLIEEKTGLGLANGEIWDYLGEKMARKSKSEDSKHTAREYGAHPSIAAVVSTMLWAALLPHHGDEYESDEGLAVVRSYMDISNFSQIASELERAFVATIPKEKLDALKKAAPEDGGAPPLASGNQPTGSLSGPQPAG